MTSGIDKVGGLASQLHQRWRDPAMLALLVIQCLTVYVLIPATASRSIVPASVSSVLPLIFASLVIFITQTEWAVAIGVVALALSGVILVLEYFQKYPSAVITEDVLAIATFLLLTAAVFVTVFTPGRFSPYRALGAIVIYLNIGLLFTLIFRLIAFTSLNAFSGLPPTGDQSSVRASLEYFSFSTFTSVGFGDIAPVSPMARGMTILEASIGHLYPATLLARVVTMVMHARGE